MSADPFIGEIMLFSGSFPPRGWALCDGSILPISTNTALYSLLGTTYGGDGRTTFALPNLNGSVPVGAKNSSTVGENVKVAVIGGASGVLTQGLTMNYCIALHGIFPSRD